MTTEWEFGQEAEQELVGTLVSVSPSRTLSAIDLLNGWKTHIARLTVESASISIQESLTWGADDLVAALHLRDLTEQAAERLSSQTQIEFRHRIDNIDDDFRKFTESDQMDLLSGWIHEPVSKSWWWHRIPRFGPIIDELRSSQTGRS